MRATDWPKQLADFIASRRSVPFIWGENDCATFPADCGVAMGCDDFLAAFRGYDSAVSAASTMSGAGYPSLLKFCQDTMQAVEPTLDYGRRGDIAVLDNGAEHTGIFRYALGIIEGKFVLTPYDTALRWVPRSLAVAAFRLG